MAFQKDEDHQFPGTLGLDIGSETTRLVIRFVTQRRGRQTFHELPVRPLVGVKYDQDDFTSLCNLTGDDGDDPYVGNGDVKGNATTTIKVGIQLLTGAEDTGLDRSPLMQIITKIVQDGPEAVERAKDRALRALTSLLQRVRDRAKKICDQNHCYIAIVGFTIPAQWHMDSQRFLENILRTVFGLAADYDIECLFEIDACAQFYLEDDIAKQTILDAQMKEHGNSYILFVDAGGYSMNTCIHHVHTKKIQGEDELFHVLVDDPAGVTGGSGHWNYLFRQGFQGKYSEELMHQLESKFDSEKYQMTDAVDKAIVCGRGMAILRREDIKRTWDIAHKDTLHLLEQKVEKLLSLKPANYAIVVSGGSSHQPFMMDAIRAICSKHSVPATNLVLTNDVDSKAKTLRLAKGLNYAMERRISVVEYISRGGGWGVVFASQRTEMNWETLARLLLDRTSPQDVTVRRHQSTENGFRLHDLPVLLDDRKHYTQVKIVGFPFTTPIPELKEHKGVRYRDAGNHLPVYDFLCLGEFRPGRYEFKLCFERSAQYGEMRLTVALEQSKQLGNEKRTAHLDVTVYHYISAGCVLCHDTDDELLEKVRQLRRELWDEDEDGNVPFLADDGGEFRSREKKRDDIWVGAEPRRSSRKPRPTSRK